MLRNCINRNSATRRTAKHEQNRIRLEAVQALYFIFCDGERWASAQDMLVRKMEIKARVTGQQDAEYFGDVLTLAKLMMEQNDTGGAQLHARRALKGFKKLHEVDEIKACLSLLINLCEMDNSENDLEIYTIMLDDMSHAEGHSNVPTGATDVNSGENDEPQVESEKPVRFGIDDPCSIIIPVVSMLEPDHYPLCYFTY